MLSGLVLELLKRAEEVESALSQQGVLTDQKKFKALAKEHAYLSEVRQFVDKLAYLDNQDI